MCSVYSFDMLSMSVFTTRHCQTSGQLVQELNVCIVSVYIYAPNAWPKYTITRPITTQLSGHGCKDYLTHESSFDSQATWVIGVLGLVYFSTCYPWVLIQPGNTASLLGGTIRTQERPALYYTAHWLNTHIISYHKTNNALSISSICIPINTLSKGYIMMKLENASI